MHTQTEQKLRGAMVITKRYYLSRGSWSNLIGHKVTDSVEMTLDNTLGFATGMAEYNPSEVVFLGVCDVITECVKYWRK